MPLLFLGGLVLILAVLMWMDSRVEAMAREIQQARHDGLTFFTTRELRDEIERREAFKPEGET